MYSFRCLIVQEVMSGSVERGVYVGHDAQHMRGVLTLHHPMKNGVVSNWDHMEMVSDETQTAAGAPAF